MKVMKNTWSSLGCRLVFFAVLLLPGLAVAGESFDHSHSAWSELLGKHVKDGKVDYKEWKRVDTVALERYLASLGGVCKETYASWTKKQKKAFFINAYNAFTIKLVVDNYPLASMKDLETSEGSAWDRKFIPFEKLEGKTLSLNDIEHEILRKRFPDARIHFALNCAAVSCPVLMPKAFAAERLGAQLKTQTRKFLSNPENNRYDPESRKLHVSKLFEWYKVDFVESAGSIAAYVASFLPEEHQGIALSPDDVKIVFVGYDWSLNAR